MYICLSFSSISLHLYVLFLCLYTLYIFLSVALSFSCCLCLSCQERLILKFWQKQTLVCHRQYIARIFQLKLKPVTNLIESSKVLWFVLHFEMLTSFEASVYNSALFRFKLSSLFQEVDFFNISNQSAFLLFCFLFQFHSQSIFNSTP